MSKELDFGDVQFFCVAPFWANREDETRQLDVNIESTIAVLL